MRYSFARAYAFDVRLRCHFRIFLHITTLFI
jgi:hypothetical protein